MYIFALTMRKPWDLWKSHDRESRPAPVMVDFLLDAACLVKSLNFKSQASNYLFAPHIV